MNIFNEENKRWHITNYIEKCGHDTNENLLKLVSNQNGIPSEDLKHMLIDDGEKWIIAYDSDDPEDTLDVCCGDFDIDDNWF